MWIGTSGTPIIGRKKPFYVFERWILQFAKCWKHSILLTHLWSFLQICAKTVSSLRRVETMKNGAAYTLCYWPTGMVLCWGYFLHLAVQHTIYSPAHPLPPLWRWTHPSCCHMGYVTCILIIFTHSVCVSKTENKMKPIAVTEKRILVIYIYRPLVRYIVILGGKDLFISVRSK